MAVVFPRNGFNWAFLIVAVVTVLMCHLTESEPTQDKQALLSFLAQIPHANRLVWNPNASACTYTGVECSADNSSVISLRLPGSGLLGPIPPNTLGNLASLRVLSLRSNLLSAPLPSDLSNLSLLRSLYLQNNNLSGQFPSPIPSLTRLARLDLSSNSLSGPIPFSLNSLTRLTGLFLENNNFSGTLPSLGQASLVALNVSGNKLNGSIPSSLSRFPASAFAGNLDLCGGPLPPCSPFFVSPSASPSGGEVIPIGKKKKKKLSTAAIVGIAVGSAVFLILLLFLLFFLCCRKRQQRKKTLKQHQPAAGVARSAGAVGDPGTSSSKDDVTGSMEGAGGERNKLVFFDGGIYSFDLEDLLRASAEVLGKGSVGTSYKAVLEEGTTVVVKRLKDVAVSKREFEVVMEGLGRVKHENVVPLRAYYFSKDEKLIVYDFMPAGSLSALLHGSRGSGRTPLDWDSRMKIALSTARGLSHLHVSNKIIHGNIKASNVLLRHNNDGSISDFGLTPLSTAATTPPNRVAGYRAPEVLETRKSTYKSDVYSFGVLLLELLTGKSPNQASLGEEGIDLPRWVQSVVREEWTAEVFDVELMRYHNIEEEMVQLLQIAMACVVVVPDQRPEMPEVVRMMEEINRGGETTDDGMRQSSDEPSKGSDGQTPPQESRTPPRSVTP